MGMLKYSAMILMAAIFGIALLSFVGDFAGDNNSQFSLDNEGNFNSSKNALEVDIDEYYVDANSSMTQFLETSAGSQVDVSERGGQFKVTSDSSLSIVKNGMQNAWSSIFGNDEGFASILLAIFSLITITIAAYFYKAWFGKNPD